MAPVLGAWSTMALGLPCGNAPDDLWALWSAGLTATDATQLNFPGPTDTATLPHPIWGGLFALLAGLAGAYGAWNTLIAAAMVVLMIGTLDLSRRIQPDAAPIARATLVIAVVGSAAWSPLARHGGLSLLPMVLLPGTLGLLDRWIQPDARGAWGLLAGAAATLSVLGHWSTSVFVLAMLIPMVVLQCRNLEGRQVWRRAFIAIAPAVIAGVLHIRQTAGPDARLSVEAAALSSLWVHQLDSALALPATSAAALPGLGILLLALAGVSARPVQTVGWLLVSAWGILLAAGLSPDGLGQLGPAHHLAGRAPLLQDLGSWWAIAPLVALPMGLSAMIGVDILHRVRRERLAIAVLVMATIDQAGPTLAASGHQTFDAHLEAGAQTALSNLPAGAVLQLRGAATRECGDDAVERLWQRWHGRPTSTVRGDERSAIMQVSYIARTANAISRASTPVSRASPIEGTAYTCALADLQSLHDMGFIAVLVNHERADNPHVVDMMTMLLGAPAFAGTQASVWAIDTPSEVPAACPLPPP